jgi:hypothetical protein
VSEVDKFIDGRLKKISKALQSFSAVMPGLVDWIARWNNEGQLFVQTVGAGGSEGDTGR